MRDGCVVHSLNFSPASYSVQMKRPLGRWCPERAASSVARLELASLPPGSPAGNPRSTEPNAISERGDVSRRFPLSQGRNTPTGDAGRARSGSLDLQRQQVGEFGRVYNPRPFKLRKGEVLLVAGHQIVRASGCRALQHTIVRLVWSTTDASRRAD